MAENTAIEWTDSTFNPWLGCTKVSPGCDHCYAEARMDTRLHTVQWGPGAPRKRTSAKNWKDPVGWNARPFCQCPTCGHRGEPVMRSGMLVGDERMAMCPKCSHGPMKPVRRRVFCASLADVFDNEVDPAWQSDLFDLIRATPNLDWLLLTKRIGNAKRLLAGAVFPNVWLGATIVTQEEADRDIPKLLATPARVRFLSMEPLLGPVDLRAHLYECCGSPVEDTGGEYMGQRETVRSCCGNFEATGLHWVIVGGESGHGARPMHPDWARSLRDQCAAAGVPFLFKQHGEWVSPGEPAFGKERCRRVTLIRPSGALVDPGSAEGRDENIDAVTMSLAGKKAAGRRLDGVEHNGFPGGTA